MYVFIGGSSVIKIDSFYYEKACDMALYLADRGYNLLCGCDCGMIGKIQDVFNKYKREIKIMEALPYRQDFYNYDVYFNDTIGERKNRLINEADLIVFLPGGLGTLDEIFTAIESKRALEYDVPIIIVNINGYYDKLIEMLDNMYKEGFASVENKSVYYIADNVDMAIRYIDGLGDIDEVK